MARKKVELRYIANESKRKATFKKRKSSLTKKMDEISILCGVEVCGIICNPETGEAEAWPSPEGVNKTLRRFRSLPQQERRKKMTTQEGFLTQLIHKAQKQLTKRRSDHSKKETRQLMFQCLATGKVFDNFNLTVLNDLLVVIDEALKDIDNGILKIKDQESSVQNGAAAITGDQAHVNGMQMNPCPHVAPPFYGDTNHQNACWPSQINP